MKEDKSNVKISLPICLTCGDILSLKINPLTFKIDYSCENEGLSSSKTFLKFSKKNMKYLNSLYDELKKEKLPKYIYEEKENNYKKILANFSQKQVCEIHNYNISEYCKICKRNICVFCKSEGDHSNHEKEIIRYSDIIPLKKECDNLSKQLLKREKFIESFIKKIELWKKEVLKNIEKLVNNLKSEIIFLKKFVPNFNKMFLNYNYLMNYNYIYKYLVENNKEINDFQPNIYNSDDNSEYNQKYNQKYDISKKSQDIYYFYNEKNFSKMTPYLINIFQNLEKKETQKLKNNLISSLNNYTIYYLNDNYFIGVNYENLNIFYFFKKELKTVAKIELDISYFQLFISPFDTKLICFNSEKIYILRYNLDEKTISIIDKIHSNRIKRCVEIKKDYLLIINDINIILLSNKKEKIKKNLPDDNSFDIYPINKEFFIYYTPSLYCLQFYDTNNLEELKQLDIKDNLLIISKFRDDYIISESKYKVYLIYIKSKEIVQIIETIEKVFYYYNYNFYINNKCIYFITEDYIYKLKYQISDKDFKEAIIEIENGKYKENLINYFLYKKF